ncbi:uncharacterized protein [Diadema setosum]|uniref:uncharacterized protein n=1 Tax=Diadema setosum TaxID=31175 RepID=UPI003B3A93A1
MRTGSVNDGEKRQIGGSGEKGGGEASKGQAGSEVDDEATQRRSRKGRDFDSGDEGRPYSGRTTASLADEIELLSNKKKEMLMKDKETDVWKQSIQEQIEQELERRVRDALETPPLERMRRNRYRARLRKQERQKKEEEKKSLSLQDCESHAQALPSLKERYQWNDLNSTFTYYNSEEAPTWFEREINDRRYREFGEHVEGCYTDINGNKVKYENGEEPDGGSPHHWRHSLPSGSTDVTVTRGEHPTPVARDGASRISQVDEEEQRAITLIRRKTFHCFTQAGFKEAVRKGKLKLKKIAEGKYVDKNGVILTADGPFWPPECGPLYPKPEHISGVPTAAEPLYSDVSHDGRTVHTQRTKWYRPWEGAQNVFDSERTSKGTIPHTVPEGCCPSLVFESRFESGNLRQARRIGQFEYDLVLKTDLYTSRHTQWFYFRVQKMIPGVTYKFNIINLLKKDSLYNHGMRPLMYSEKEVSSSGVGWVRTGHHIIYNRSCGFNRNGLLHPELTYYVLEWQMEFHHADDTCYLAHCYPFTFTDLCQHLDQLMKEPERRKTMRREVLCETRAGNSCFLLTVTNFHDQQAKKGVVVTARVHPGETNASWMMKGLLDFITSSDPVAKELRKCYIFKIIPMLNPDGVIVGNYRCSLAGRDLNRNYRHPKKESFPTVWNTKQMLTEFSQECGEVLVYCDMHGHSRKHNVFIYGCDPESQEVDMAAFLCQRLFPWLLSQKAPDKFSFRGCKFRVKRCKEATGRVVMWRQMGINNSFTLEATFCGSKNITVEAPRHFNLQDFQDLGRHFCEALLVYHQAQENSSLHSELILELTKEITHHILRSRGLLPPDMPLPDLTTQGLDDKLAAPTISRRSDKEWAGLDKRTRSKLAALKMIDTLSSETIQGCVDLLADLHVQKEFAESETSDSDSASESEVAKDVSTDDDKNRKKKKKKKPRGRLKSDQAHQDAENEERAKKKVFQLGKCPQAVKKYPPFVNRYTNRSNNGIPMFSQERIEERAKQRMLGTKGSDKDTADGDDETVDQVAHDNEYARLIALSREMHRQSEEVRYKLINPATEGSLQKSLAGMTIKHGYTHGNSLRGATQFNFDLERTDSDESPAAGIPPRTPPRKLNPVRGAATKGPEKKSAFASYTIGLRVNKVNSNNLDVTHGNGSSRLDSSYAIKDGILVDGGMKPKSKEEIVSGIVRHMQSVGDKDPTDHTHRHSIPGPLHSSKLVDQQDALCNGEPGSMLPNSNTAKQTASSLNATSSWATRSKSDFSQPSEPKFHSANAVHDSRRHVRNAQARENTIDFIQRQYGHFLTGINTGTKGATPTTAKYLESIAKSLPSGNQLTVPVDRGGGGAVTLSKSASFINEERKKQTPTRNKLGDSAAILKLAESKKKSSLHRT